MSAKKSDRRRFPRKEAKVKVKLSAMGGPGREFEAHLPSWDISIGGIFVESEFFIKAGTRLELTFELPGVVNALTVRGEVVREERIQRPGGDLRSGFAIRFSEYLEDAWLSLASFFLAPEAKRFVTAYRKTGRQNRIRGEVERMVDLIVAWEMNRFEAGKRKLTP